MLPAVYNKKANKELIKEVTGCLGKIKYPAYDIAWMVFLTYYFPFGKEGKYTRELLGKLSCYRCRYCGAWHIGSSGRQKI